VSIERAGEHWRVRTEQRQHPARPCRGDRRREPAVAFNAPLGSEALKGPANARPSVEVEGVVGRSRTVLALNSDWCANGFLLGLSR